MPGSPLRFTLFLFVMIVFFQHSAQAGENDNIELASQRGSILFQRSFHPESFWPIDLNFVTQSHTAYCSIASSVMVLNALKIPAPDDPQYAPYHLFNQKNFFTKDVRKYISPENVKKRGATLDEISRAIQCYPVKVITLHANTFSVSQFRSLGQKTLKHHDRFLIVNYLRTAVGQQGGGHMSPLAAYDSQSDRFLILDVSRYHYPPLWIKTDRLWNAMHTVDKLSHRYRGLIIIQKNIRTIPLKEMHRAVEEPIQKDPSQ